VERRRHLATIASSRQVGHAKSHELGRVGETPWIRRGGDVAGELLQRREGGVQGAAPGVVEGRDPAAQHDAALLDAGTPGFQNEGDNEVTGVHVSSGSPFVAGMQGRMGAVAGARWFFTQQHGKNQLWEILPEAS
jgi:hypothetical protein